MGSTSSKGARTAAGAVTRKYPSRIPPTASPRAPPSGAQQDPSSSTADSQTQARGKRDEGVFHHSVLRSAMSDQSASTVIDRDGVDPQYAASLRSLGAVQPNTMFSTMFSHSSTFHRTTAPRLEHPQFPDPSSNPAIQILLARDRLAAEAEKEFTEAGRKSHPGRQFLDIFLIRQVLMLRDEKMVSPEEIERRLGLKPGVVQRLGKKGIVGLAGHLGG